VFVFQETALSRRLLSTLQEDQERLQASHTVQLEKLRLQLNAQIQKTELAHSRKVSTHSVFFIAVICTKYSNDMIAASKMNFLLHHVGIRTAGSGRSVGAKSKGVEEPGGHVADQGSTSILYVLLKPQNHMDLSFLSPIRQRI